MMQTSSQPISKTIGLIVFPLRNPDDECGQSFIPQLEQKLREILTNTQLRKDLGTNVRMLAERKLSWDRIIRDWIRFVEGPR
jgi:glycosyltransferase involved in cell wall biosynthesis